MRTVLALVGVLAGIAAAAAQQPTAQQSSAIRSACRSDYQSYCSSVPTGGQASLSCLQQNAAALSPACRHAVGAVGGGTAAPAPQTGTAAPAPQTGTAAPAPAKPPALKPAHPPSVAHACAADHRAFCARFQPGTLRAAMCMRDNESRLSPPCRQALAMAREKAQSGR